MSSNNIQPQTFVLVHGGWFGGWCWQAVAEQLRDAGHTVYTPTLTGLGERSHLASPQITLKTHAQDIANVLIYEDLHEVILLGHSYAGMPVTLVPDLVGERIQHLIYLDAFVPLNGQSLSDIVDGPDNQAFQKEWLRPPPSIKERWHVEDEALLKSLESRLTPQITSSHFEQVVYKPSPTIKKTYISLTRNQKPHFIRTANRLKKDPNWQHIDLDGGHLIMAEEPEKLVACLRSTAISQI